MACGTHGREEVCIEIFDWKPRARHDLAKIHSRIVQVIHLKKLTKLRGLSPQTNYIPTERPPLVGEISANFNEQRVSRGQRNESSTVVFNSGFLDRSSSIIITRLGGPRSRPTTSRKFW
jgi:hypothetical protein